jgi:outer membrane receptor protein involved in Fe transport
MRKFLSAGVAAVLALVAIAASADGSAADAHVSLAIESKTLGEALDQWAAQTGYQIVVPNWALAKKLPGATLKGSFDPRAALERLLEDTPLTWALVNERSVLVLEKARSPPAKETPGADDKPPPSRLPVERSGTALERLEEVVVTAQKREEKLQDVPISIAVVDGRKLDRSTARGITETLAQISGVAVSVDAQAPGTLLSVRGVSAPAGYNSGSSPIGYYMDSVPFGFVRMAIVPELNVYDVDRIEVLRGPQGTLYGAGSQNGVVRVLTRDANLTDFEFKAHTAWSQTEDGDGSVRADAAINVPLIEGKLAARAVAGYQDLSGWIDKSARKDANDGRMRNGRIKINAQPTDNLALGLSVWMSRSDLGAPSTGLENRTVPTRDLEPISMVFDLYGLKATYDFPAFSVSSATSYLEYVNDGDNDLSPIGLASIQKTRLSPRTFAEEINLSSTGLGAWRWTAGAIYRDGRDRQFVSRTTTPLPQSIEFTSESWAAFGELTRVLADGHFELTGGVRYFEDQVTTAEESRLGVAPPAQLITTEQRFDSTTPRVVLTWLPRPQTTFYASYSQGFRSGFDQLPTVIAAVPGLPPVQPDLLKNYEVGAKGNLLNGALGYDAAVYYMDWDDVQLPVVVGVGGINRAAAVNGPSASGIGADLALSAIVAERLELTVACSWNDLSVDENMFSGGVLLFERGARLNNSTEYTLGASLNYSVPVGGRGLEAGFSLSGTVTAALETRSLDGATRSVTRGDEIGIGRASFFVQAPDKWTAMLFVDNFNDESGAVFKGTVPAFDSRIRPRTIGVQLDYSF